MKIESERFFEALKEQLSLDESLTQPPFLKELPDQYLKWLRASGLPPDFQDFLQQTALSEEYPLGSSTLNDWERNIKHNDEYPILKEQGFFIIGTACNGDPVAIQWKTLNGATGYLSHDQLWVGNHESPNPHKYFKQLADSIGEFTEKAVPIDGFPLDYYGTMPE